MELRALCQRLNNIYAEKNIREGVLTDIYGVTLFIAGALKALNDDATRRDFKNKDALLAILMKRMLLAIELWGVEMFTHALSRKYPLQGCVYCNCKPCACGKQKSAPAQLVASNGTMDTWSLSNWQQHLEDIYGATNRHRYSVQDMVIQLNTEYLEAMIALHHRLITRSSALNEVSRTAACEETTDFFSRLLGICNHVGVDIEDAVLKHYRNGCPVCTHMVCVCPPFWEEYEAYEYAVAVTTIVR